MNRAPDLILCVIRSLNSLAIDQIACIWALAPAHAQRRARDRIRIRSRELKSLLCHAVWTKLNSDDTTAIDLMQRAKSTSQCSGSRQPSVARIDRAPSSDAIGADRVDNICGVPIVELCCTRGTR